ncbi:hypothetical protein ACFVV7_36010 [Streptomyces globisporus]|uniref:hypothetical protein n=1 Tax=Streptomyces globisporus TaxID=1908 RepID=UPI0036DD46E6
MGYAAELAFHYDTYGVSRESAGWVVQYHLQQVEMHVLAITERYVSGARTGWGRAWRRRKARPYLEALSDAFWYAERMQGAGEVFWPPALFYRDDRLPLIEQSTLPPELRVPESAL